ncbi:MAG: thiamine-phosphate kinase [Micrococcaceae bacterium]
MASRLRLAGQRVGDLGEHGVLTAISRIIAGAEQEWPDDAVGPGDDAAVIPAEDGRVVISTDAMTRDRDFRTEWPSGIRDNGFSTGWKAAAQNLSDINAMGASSTALVMALTMPAETEIEWVKNFVRGMLTAIRNLHGADCRLAGGDLGSGKELTVAVTAIGSLTGSDPIRRISSTSSANLDRSKLIHTGQIGWASAGLSVLETPRYELEEILQASADSGSLLRLMARAVRAQLRPRPPLDQGLAVQGELNAMMDVSDGLVRDSHRLGSANGLNVALDHGWIESKAEELRPLADALGQDASDWVRRGGEDYGLLGMIDADASVPFGWSRCGTFHLRERSDVTSASTHENGGWDHFSR